MLPTTLDYEEILPSVNRGTTRKPSNIWLQSNRRNCPPPPPVPPHLSRKIHRISSRISILKNGLLVSGFVGYVRSFGPIRKLGCSNSPVRIRARSRFRGSSSISSSSPSLFRGEEKKKKKRKKDEAVQVGREEKRLEAGVHSGQTAH